MNEGYLHSRALIYIDLESFLSSIVSKPIKIRLIKTSSRRESYYRHFHTNIKSKNHKINPSLVNPGLRPRPLRKKILCPLPAFFIHIKYFLFYINSGGLPKTIKLARKNSNDNYIREYK